jgi:hypothetical protein
VGLVVCNVQTKVGRLDWLQDTHFFELFLAFSCFQLSHYVLFYASKLHLQIFNLPNFSDLEGRCCDCF